MTERIPLESGTEIMLLPYDDDRVLLRIADSGGPVVDFDLSIRDMKMLYESLEEFFQDEGGEA